MSQQLISIGLYRHFKGEYYYVTSLCKSAVDERTVMVNYFNVCHPEYGSFVRPLDDFCATFDVDSLTKEVKYLVDREDNTTGQHMRFERVESLNFQLGSISTEQLVDELRKRTDSPIHELDIEELHSNVFCKDYVVGEPCDTDFARGVYTVASFDTQQQAEKYFSTHQHTKLTKVFKRTFIEVD